VKVLGAIVISSSNTADHGRKGQCIIGNFFCYMAFYGVVSTAPYWGQENNRESIIGWETITSSSLRIDKKLTSESMHVVVSPAARMAIMVTGKWVVFLHNFFIEFSTREFFGCHSPKVLFIYR